MDHRLRPRPAGRHRRVIPHGHELVVSPDQHHFIPQPTVAYRGCRMPGQAPHDDFPRFHLMVLAELVPEPFVGHGEEGIVARADTGNVEVTSIQFQRLGIATR